MRLTLSVSGLRAGLLGSSAIRVFGREGGTIGRSPEADWALPDPNRYLSQFHARILWLHDAFWIEDTSSNGTFVNGAASALGRGARHRLAEGDSIAVGDYAIIASVGSAALTSPFEPAAGLAEAPIDFGAAAPIPPAPQFPILPIHPEAPPAPVSGAAPAQSAAAGASPTGLEAELAALLASLGAAPSATVQDPFQRISPQAVTPVSLPAATMPALPLPILPAPPPAPSLAPSLPQLAALTSPVPPAVSQLALPQAVEVAMPALALPDPVHLPGGQPPAAMVMEALPSAVPTPPPASGIPAPALAMVMPLPRSTNAAPAHSAPAKPAMPVVAMPSELPPDLLADLTDLPHVGPEAAGAAIPVPRRASRPPRQSGQGESSDIAFWRGLGIEPDSLSPEERAAALEAFGRAMRTAADGLVALLGARRFVKSEVDLEQTQLAAADNNAFKFSPSGEAALRRLMDNETGFTPVDLAVGRAFDDLRAHELGVAAGMKAALGAMLERLAPASIERRFAPIRGGLFTSKKARLWELYTSLYSEIADGAESRFKDAFSRSFATAYDQRAREASRPGDR